MNSDLMGQQFVEKACYELLKAGIKTFNYEKEDCDIAVGYVVDIKDDSGSTHRVTVNIENPDGYDRILVGMPMIKLDQEDLDDNFCSSNTESDFIKYMRLFTEYFTTREHFFDNHFVQSDRTDPYSEIIGIEFTLDVSRELGSQIFEDEDSISVMEYLDRLAYLVNDINSLLTASLIGFGNLKERYNYILDKYHLEK